MKAITILMILICLASVTTATLVDLNKYQIDFFSFNVDEDGDINDSQMTVVDAIRRAGGGPVGDGDYKFGGGNDKVVNNTDYFPLDAAEDRSYSMWVNVTAYGGDFNTYFWIMACVGATARPIYMAHSWVTGGLDILYTDTQDQENFVSIPFSVANEYVHIVWVQDSGNFIKVYVNGELNYTDETVGATLPTYACTGTNAQSNSMTIGGDKGSGDTDGSLSGTMDQVGIWRYALTAADVDIVYSQSTAPFVSVGAPQINESTLNMTSDGGCTAWRTDKNAYCNTTDGTPLVTFDTLLIANCSWSTTNAYNAAYATTRVGDYTHIGTLDSSIALAYGTDDMFINCDFSGTANQTGALNINMTAGTPGGGEGLVSCINEIGAGCGVVIDAGCADVTIP